MSFKKEEKPEDMRIIIQNNKSKIECLTKVLIKLRNHPAFAIRAKGAFFSPAFQQRRWDGYIRFISDRGYIDTGKLPQLLTVLATEFDISDPILIDAREFSIKPKIVKSVGPMTLRQDQLEALKALTQSKLNSQLPFPRGVLGAATNFGKTLLSAAIFKTYNAPTLFILNSKELFQDAAREMPRLLGEENVGYIASGYPLRLAPFTIVMVQTAKARIQELGESLAKYPVVLVDEGDLATSPTYRVVLNHTYNSFVRVALSGSAFADKRQKEKNERLRSIFGDLIFSIKNKDLIEKGVSSPITVYLWQGNTMIKSNDFTEEYKLGIIESKERNHAIIQRAKFHVSKGRLPMLILCQKHRHVEILFRRVKRAFPLLKTNWVHHKKEDRQNTVLKFEKGKIDILVGSYILKRGKNFPLMKVLINASAGDSISNVLQIIGRAARKHGSKKKTIMDDFYDLGTFLRRHSKHRETTYKNESLEVIKKYTIK